MWNWEEIERSLPETPFFSVKEVAKILKVGRTTIHARIKRGELLAVKVGRVWIIPREELVRYLNEHANLNEKID